MKIPVMRGVITATLVLASIAAAFATLPVFIHNNSTNPVGNLKPFCPEFTSWLENPHGEPCNVPGTLHGLGLIPAPVSIVGTSPGNGPVARISSTGVPMVPPVVVTYSLPGIPAFSCSRLPSGSWQSV